MAKSSDPQPATTSSISSGGDSSIPSPSSITSASCTTATDSSNQTVPSLSLQGTPSANTSHQLPAAATYSGINDTQTQSGYSAITVNDTSALAYSEGRLATMKLNMLHTLPYKIPQQIFEQIAELDSKAVISGFGVNGWPTTYTYTYSLWVEKGTLGVKDYILTLKPNTVSHNELGLAHVWTVQSTMLSAVA